MYFSYTYVNLHIYIYVVPYLAFFYINLLHILYVCKHCCECHYFDDLYLISLSIKKKRWINNMEYFEFSLIHRQFLLTNNFIYKTIFEIINKIFSLF